METEAVLNEPLLHDPATQVATLVGLLWAHFCIKAQMPVDENCIHKGVEIGIYDIIKAKADAIASDPATYDLATACAEKGAIRALRMAKEQGSPTITAEIFEDMVTDLKKSVLMLYLSERLRLVTKNPSKIASILCG